ncbi:MAG: YdcF family protein [Phycisphaeraceae bacterium]
MKDHRNQWGLTETLIRGGALFLGSYFMWSWLLFFTGTTHYDATIWWVDLRFLPGWLAGLVSIVFCVALLHRGLLPNASKSRQGFRKIALSCLLAALILNTLVALRLSMSSVMLGMPIPLTAVLALGVGMMLRRPKVTGPATWFLKLRRCSGVVVCAAGFALLAALAQMFWFGESDYRRPADAILVYGCKAYADGRPSQALADRVHTATELYHQGLAPVIVMSGGPVRNTTMHETQAMADYAVSLGVPREVILFDAEGLDTQATAENLRGVLASKNTNDSLRILAVSHDYHLPRVKLSLEREGLKAYTVPAEIRRGLPSKPYLMARETAAWWYYFFRPIVTVID